MMTHETVREEKRMRGDQEWKKEVIEKLRDYPYQVMAVRNITEEIAIIDSEMTSISSARFDGSPVRGGGNRREDVLLNQIVRKGKLEERRTITNRKVRHVKRGMLALSDKERRVLEVFYVRRPDDHVGILAEELYIEKSEVYDVKDIALKKLTLAMYGIEKL